MTLFFYIYVVSVLLFGSFLIGPFSIRVYLTVIMMVYLLASSAKKKKGSNYPIPKNFLTVFFVFILFSGIALLLNGEYSEYEFNKWIMAYYLNCFVSFFAIDHFITDSTKLKNFIYVLVGIITVNAIVTILQLMGNPIGRMMALTFTTISEVRSTISDADSNSVLFLAGSRPIGLFGMVFTNGTMLGVMSILCLAHLKSFGLLKQGFLIIALLLCLYACFGTQERAAFVLCISMCLFLFIAGPFQIRSKTLLVSFLVIAAITILPSLLLSEKLGRIGSISFEEDSRTDIWSYAISFIKDHLLLGGPVSYYKRTEDAPHNFFLFVLIHNGLIAGIIISYLYIKMTIQAILLLLKKYSFVTKTIAGAVCVYSALSLFHNSSIATGDTIIFILYPLLLKSYLIDKKEQISFHKCV